MGEKKKAQSDNTSINSIEGPIKAHEEYFDWNEFRTKPMSERFIVKLGHEFVHWCKNSKSIIAGQFFSEKGIDHRTYYRWMDRCPEFEKAYRHGLSILGNKREVGAIEKRYSEKMVMHRMHAYDPEWKDSDKYQASLRNNESNSNEPKIVVIEKFRDKEDEPIKIKEQNVSDNKE